jgi:Outer membrane protein beta-barrel domain
MKTLVKTIAALAMAITVNFGAAAQDYEHENDYDHTHKSSKRHNMFSRKDFGLYLGLNTYESENLPELDNLKSRYVALNWRKNHRLITGNQVDVALGTGFEFAWNNFMLKDDLVLKNQTNGASFIDSKESLNKSKLVVTSLNIPLMLQFGFKESHWKLGLGAYGGARIDSYMKTMGESGKKRTHGAYNLNKFHYGLAAELGRNNFAFFARYEMTPMFQDKNPINGNAISFGIRL